jgi:protein required for attachment to host cells
MLVSHGAIILVIDGAKISLFRNRGRAYVVDLELIEREAKPAAHAAELGTDKPGRSFSSMGQGRSAYQSSDFHQAEEDTLTMAASEKLNTLAQDSNLDFFIVAAPHALGLMRRHYSTDLRKRLVAEIDKDFAGRSAADVADLLGRHEP